ncbi:MAG: 1-acyl-sn-glycerol-3-phosphate acyltransferase [Spirochaetaceae bacterium]|jgi:glycerol-3-phosphate O-acyltransferase|nr:1-acyl-sn-glycerol-3-phosphate acyltransferase [Spirochaetaceae bacterium]
MEPQPLKVRYRHLFKDLAALSRAENNITEENVFQPANKDILKIITGMLEENVLPDSELRGQEHLRDFLSRVKGGQRGLILMEHYSNFDLPGFYYFLQEKGGEAGRDIADRLVAISGLKLNEDNAMVSAWAEAYSRIIIYPSRGLASITDPVKHAEEDARSKKINFASMRVMDRLRKEGKVLLVFPSGTRYRPGKPETRRGVREIDSYIRLSDVMMPVSINGNCLRISDKPEDMLEDMVYQDTIIMEAGPVLECKPFREEVLDSVPEEMEDKKQAVVDRVMDILLQMHEKNEAELTARRNCG